MHPPRRPAAERNGWVRACFLASLLLGSCGGGGGGGGDPGGSIAPPGAGGPGPELRLTDVAFSPAFLTAGDPLTVSDTVANDGDQAASNFQVGVYLSADALVTPSDVLLGFRTIASLAPKATSTGGGTLTLPLTTPSGTYWIGAVVDDQDAVQESNEADNTRAATGTISVTAAPLPDLVGASIAFQPLVVVAGNAIVVTESVANTGSAAANGVVVGVYLSSDATITAADVLLGFRSLAALDIGETSAATATFSVPANTLAGLYRVGVLVDDVQAHVEPDESNNALVAPVVLQVDAPPRPDLVPSGVAFGPATLDAGDALAISDAVLNQGLVDAGPFRIGVYLSSDATITKSDLPIGARFLPRLEVGVSSSISGGSFTVPIDTPGGAWFVGVLVDDLGAVAEMDEGNNALAALGKLQVKVPPAPDLAPTALSFSPTSVQPALGEKVTATDTIQNIGVLPAGPFRVGYYLSSNPVVTQGDLLVGSRAISALAVGESSTASTSFALPTGVGPGSYFIGVIADDEGAVLEVQEKNNALTSAVPLDVIAAPMPMPELVMESVSFSPKTVPAGGVVQIQEVVRNHGTLSASSFHVGVYLSSDANISTADILLGQRTVPGLAIGFGSATSAPYTIPPGTPPGTYHVGAVCDVANQIAESVETDNALAAVGTIAVN